MREKNQLTSFVQETIMFALLFPPIDLFISLYFTIINHTIRKNNSVWTTSQIKQIIYI